MKRCARGHTPNWYVSPTDNRPRCNTCKAASDMRRYERKRGPKRNKSFVRGASLVDEWESMGKRLGSMDQFAKFMGMNPRSVERALYRAGYRISEGRWVKATQLDERRVA